MWYGITVCPLANDSMTAVSEAVPAAAACSSTLALAYGAKEGGVRVLFCPHRIACVYTLCQSYSPPPPTAVSSFPLRHLQGCGGGDLCGEQEAVPERSPLSAGCLPDRWQYARRVVGLARGSALLTPSYPAGISPSFSPSPRPPRRNSSRPPQPGAFGKQRRGGDGPQGRVARHAAPA